jgi:hypothetical protein
MLLDLDLNLDLSSIFGNSLFSDLDAFSAELLNNPAYSVDLLSVGTASYPYSYPTGLSDLTHDLACAQSDATSGSTSSALPLLTLTLSTNDIRHDATLTSSELAVQNALSNNKHASSLRALHCPIRAVWLVVMHPYLPVQILTPVWHCVQQWSLRLNTDMDTGYPDPDPQVPKKGECSPVSGMSRRS